MGWDCSVWCVASARARQPVDVTEGPPDLVRPWFVATRPKQLWVSDLTYWAARDGFTYVAIVIDVFALRIVPYEPL